MSDPSFFNPSMVTASKVFQVAIEPKSNSFVLSSQSIQTQKSVNHVSIWNICHQVAEAARY
jgi:hypothetical protein